MEKKKKVKNRILSQNIYVLRNQEEQEESKRKVKNRILERTSTEAPIGKVSGLGYYTGKAGLGALGIVEGAVDIVTGGIADLLGNDDYADYVFQYDTWVNDLNEKLDEGYKPKKVGKFFGDVSSGLGQSATFLIPYVGQILFVAGMWGNAVSSASQKTGEVGGREYLYGAGSAAVEWVLERFISGSGQTLETFGKQTAKNVGSKVVKSFGKTAAKTTTTKMVASQLVSSAAGEAVEEFLGSVWDPIWQRWSGVDDEAKVDWGDAAYSALVGLVSGGILGGVSTSVQTAYEGKRGAALNADPKKRDVLLKQARYLVDNAEAQGLTSGSDTVAGHLAELRGGLTSYQNAKDKNSAGAMIALGKIERTLVATELNVITDARANYVASLSEAERDNLAEWANAYFKDAGVTVTAKDLADTDNLVTRTIATMDWVGKIVDTTLGKNRVLNTEIAEAMARQTMSEKQLADEKKKATAQKESDRIMTAAKETAVSLDTAKWNGENASYFYEAGGERAYLSIEKNADGTYQAYMFDDKTFRPLNNLTAEQVTKLVDGTKNKLADTTKGKNANEKNKRSKDEVTPTEDTENAEIAEKTGESGTKTAEGDGEAEESTTKSSLGADPTVLEEGGAAKSESEYVEKEFKATPDEVKRASKTVKGFKFLPAKQREAIIEMMRTAGNIDKLTVSSIAHFMASREGLNVRFMKNHVAEGSFDVLTKSGERLILLDPKYNNGKHYRADILAHELYHDIIAESDADAGKALNEMIHESVSPSLRREIADRYTKHFNGKSISEYLAEKNEKWTEKNVKEYFKEYTKISYAEIMEEVSAGVMGKIVGQRRFIRQLRAKGLLARTFDHIRNICGAIANRAMTVGGDSSPGFTIAFRDALQFKALYSQAVIATNTNLTPALVTDLKKALQSVAELDEERARTKLSIGEENADRVMISESGNIDPTRFSLEFAPRIAERQIALEQNKVDGDVLRKAIADTSAMVAKMLPYRNILPPDKIGKTVVSNGSYDRSIENTTICVRTLAYNEFTDLVQEKLGRPLTAMESFLVSQKLYDIAKEPQCLYCYVSLDRKAYNEMMLRYIKDRDAVIEEWKASDQSAQAREDLYQNFLRGRKPTSNMRDNFDLFLSLAENGGELTMADIATEKKRAEIANYGTPSQKDQLDKILKYAQSASWAKKQQNYVAYNDEIIRFKPGVVNNLNKHYGLRWYSFSDYSGAFIVENMQQITDAALKGLKGLAYTKDTDFVEIFAPSGININISVFVTKGKEGFVIDEAQSADLQKAIELRKKYPNVGIVAVATDNEGVRWALDQEWSDVVIPFHTVRTGADVANFYEWDVYNEQQSDKVENETLWEAYVASVGKKKVSKNIYPSEHHNDQETYLNLCAERGLKPRFSDFIDNANYMKLVNETRQSADETKPLQPIFNLDAAEASFQKFVDKGGYYDGWYFDNVDIGAESSAVASDIAAGKTDKDVDYGRQDVEYETMLSRRKQNRQHSGTKLSLAPDQRTFSYNELVAKGDLTGVSVDSNKTVKLNNGIIDKNWVLQEVRTRCYTRQRNNGTIYYAHVPDIEENVEIPSKGITHGFDRPNDKPNGRSTDAAKINAIAALNIVDILRNSIEVNRSVRGSNIDVPYTHVLIGSMSITNANGIEEYYAVRSMVQERRNQNPILVEVNILGNLTAINAKKIATPAAWGSKNTVARTGGSDYYAYNIAHFLQDVKGVFDDTFSNDVYQTLGTSRNTNEFSKNLRYSLPMLPDASNVEAELNERDWGFEWTDGKLLDNVKTVRAYLEKAYPDAAIAIEIDNKSRRIKVTSISRFNDFVERNEAEQELHDFLTSLGIKDEQIGPFLSSFEPSEKAKVAKTIKDMDQKPRPKVFYRNQIAKTTEGILSHIITPMAGGDAKMLGKDKKKLVTWLLRRMNTAENAEDRRKIARIVAEAFIARTVYADMDVNAEYETMLVDGTIETFEEVKSYLGKIRADSVKADGISTYDKSKGGAVLRRWLTKGDGISIHDAIAELQDQGILTDTEAKNEADMLIALNEEYERLKGLTELRREFLPLANIDKARLDEIQKNIEDIMLGFFRSGGKETKYSQLLRRYRALLSERDAKNQKELEELEAKLSERFTKRIDKMREEADRQMGKTKEFYDRRLTESQYAYRYAKKLTRIIADARNLRDYVNRDYMPAEFMENPQTKGIAKAFLKAVSRTNVKVEEAKEAARIALEWADNIKKTDETFIGGLGVGAMTQDEYDALSRVARSTSEISLEIEELEDFHTALQAAIRNYKSYDMLWDGERYVQIGEKAREAVEQQLRAKEESERDGWFAKMSRTIRKIGLQFLDPLSAAAAIDGYNYDGVFQELLTKLAYAEAEKNKMMGELRAPFEEFLKNHKKYEERLASEVIELTPEIKITVGQAITLSEMYKRDQAKAALAISRIAFNMDDGTVRKLEGYGETPFLSTPNGKKVEIDTAKEVRRVYYNNRANALATLHEYGYDTSLREGAVAFEQFERDLAAAETEAMNVIRQFGDQRKQIIEDIAKQFTDEDREFIKLVSDFFQTTSKKAKKDADIRNLGYTNVIEGYYFPIKRRSADMAKNIADGSFFSDFITSANISFNHSTMQGAKASIDIFNVWDILTEHIEGLALWEHLYLPVQNINKIYNKNVTVQNSPLTVKNILSERTDGDWGKWLADLLLDVQGARRKETKTTFDSLINWVRGKYAVYQLGLNPQTVVKQTLSWAAASQYISPASIAKGLLHPKLNHEQLNRVSAVAAERMDDATVIRAMSNTEKFSKAAEKTMWGITKMDRFVNEALFAMCQEEVAARNPDMPIGSEENLIEAGKLVSEVILKVQDSSDVMTKSQAARSSSELLKAFTMFQSAGIKMFSRIFENVGFVARYRTLSKADQTKYGARYKQAQKQLAKSVGALSAVAVLTALIVQLFKWIYNKDREDKDGNEITMIEDFATDAATEIVGVVPIIGDIVDYYVNGYEVSNFFSDTFNDTLKAVGQVVSIGARAVGGDVIEDWEVGSMLRKVSRAAGSLTGIPVRNVENTLSGIVRRVAPEAGYSYDTLFYDPNYTEDVKKALNEGDTEMAAHIVELMMKRKKTGGKTYSADTINTLVELRNAGYENVFPKTVKIDDMDRKTHKKFISVYGKADSAVDKLVTSKEFKAFADLGTDEASPQATAITTLYNAYFDLAEHDVLGEELTRGAAYISVTDAHNLMLVKAYDKAIKLETVETKGSRKAMLKAYMKDLGMDQTAQAYAAYSCGFRTDDVKNIILADLKGRKDENELLIALGLKEAEEKEDAA